MSLKVFQLAKELGIDSKVIVKKCKDEQIPNIETHMSPVTAGLAATIREWFSSGELKTAIESTQHIEAARIQKAPRKRSSSKKAAGSASHAGAHSGDSSATAVAEPPEADAEAAPATESVETTEPEVATEVHEAAPPEPAVAEAPQPIAPPPETTETAPPVTQEAQLEAPEAAPVEAAPPEPAAPPARPVHPAEVAPPVIPIAPARPVRPAASAAPQAPARPAAQTPAKPVPPAAPVLQKPVRPAVMPKGIPNVPTRPTNISPVGPQVRPAPAQLQGPKVIRVEQPDQVPAPRPMRPRPPGVGGGPGAGGPGGPGGPNRSPGFAMPPMPVPGAGSSGRSRSGRESAAPVDDEESAAKKKARTNRRGVGSGRRGDAGADAIREWREADLLERQDRIAGSAGALRERKREMSKQLRSANAPHGTAPRSTHVEITPPVTIRELSEAMGVKSSDILKKLMAQGVMATVNQIIEPETAQVLALEFGLELVVKQRESEATILERQYKEREEAAEKVARPPVVTILGHVDHGKTSLLDKIRSANVAAGEAGGITQHVGAYTVELAGSDGKPKRVTFLDTPGHQAFTAMRARGANMTDVVVLVVAADDGVMPQTVESINHAKAAGVPIVVALNKIDKPEANANKVLGQLAEQGLNPAEWGGDTEVVRTSATTGQGVKELIEYLDYVATLRELKASPALPARGAVIESFMDPNRGVVARVLVQNGTLHVGDTVVCGPAWGRVRSITDDKGRQIHDAGPATPVEVIGLDTVPGSGDKLYAIEDANEAREIADERKQADRVGEIAQRSKVTLENLFDTIQQGTVKELRVILKADVQGSVDVLKQLLTEELSKEVKVRLLHAAVGGVSESDVLLAEASDAIIIGFSVVPDETARKLAESLGVEIRTYRIIYEITDDIRKALTGMLAPSKQDQVLGHAEIRQVIKVSRHGNIAGCMVTDGLLQRNNKFRLIRDGAVVTENLTLDSLKRFKEDVKEVRGGVECGLKLAGYDDIKVGDRLEAYKTVDVARTL
ncbi:MAG TPA: translation initiation factor IF-2 [Phycisphaerae bacterium]|nr:translation initiation factor IF-2 [Phycisphaerae bacterium]